MSLQPSHESVLVLVTAPDLEVARKLARGALEGRLAACANLLPQLESHYWWQGKIESSPEVQMFFKTAESRVAALEEFVLANHPYDTPEFIVLPMSAVSEKYQTWLHAAIAPDPTIM